MCEEKVLAVPGVLGSVPPSDESETEWKDEMEDAGAWREMPSLDSGG